MSELKFTILILVLFVAVSFGLPNKTVITKCCKFGQHILVGVRTKCNRSEDLYNFDEVIIYDKDIRKTGKKLMDVFTLVPSSVTKFKLGLAYDFSSKCNNYLIEDGTVMQELPNTYDRWTHLGNDKFCIDVALLNGSNILKPVVRIWTIPPASAPEEDFQASSAFNVTCLLISSFFLVLVIIIYSMLPELRNLAGMILMAYVISLLGAFLNLSILHFISLAEENTLEICLRFTFVIYYFFLSSFCWMNVMSIDIWWNFRGYAKHRLILRRRRGEKFKFFMYCAYAFGLPAAMTVMLGLIDQADLTHIPWFVKPDLNGSGCFLKGSGKFMYLYIPMLIIIVMNWILFLMTAIDSWRGSRREVVLDSPEAGSPSAHRTQRLRLMLYLKLSVIMGVSWVLEVASSLAPEFRGWYLSDAYNLLMGLFIFLIFVCKKKIFKKLEKKLGAKRTQCSPDPLVSNSRSASVSSDSDSQDTTTQICLSPSGARYCKA